MHNLQTGLLRLRQTFSFSSERTGRINVGQGFCECGNASFFQKYYFKKANEIIKSRPQPSAQFSTYPCTYTSVQSCVCACVRTNETRSLPFQYHNQFPALSISKSVPTSPFSLLDQGWLVVKVKYISLFKHDLKICLNHPQSKHHPALDNSQVIISESHSPPADDTERCIMGQAHSNGRV